MRRQVAMVVAIGLFYHMSSSAAKILVPLHIASEGASVGAIGIVLAAHPLLPIFLSIPAGALADRFGFRTMTMLGASGMVFAAGLLFLSSGLGSVLIAQMLLGLGELLVWLSAQALATNLGPPEARVKNLGYFGFAIALAQTIGPGTAGVLADSVGFKNAFLMCLALSLLTLLSAIALPTTRPDRAKVPPMRDQIRASFTLAGRPRTRAALLCTFTMILTRAVRRSFFPVFLMQSGYAASSIGFLVSLAEGSSTVVRGLLGKLLNYMTEDQMVVAGMLVGVVATSLTPVLPNTALLALASVIAGVGLGLNLPLTMALIAGDAPEHLRGVAMGLRLTSNRAAQLATPIIFGVVGNWLSLGATFYVVGIPLLTGVGLTSVLLKRSRQCTRPASAT